MSKSILFFGFGYCAQYLAPLLAAQGWSISATCRDNEKAQRLESMGIAPLKLEGAPLSAAALNGVSHIVLSAAPDEAGDPALPSLRDALAQNPTQFQWLGYLSTTGVYGDHDGAWIDEDTPRGPLGARGQRRVDAEAAWGELADTLDLPMHYFRLAGIYGPGATS